MSPPNHKSKPWVRIAIVLGIWMALAVVFAGQAYLFLYSASQAEEDLPKHPPGLALNELFLTSLAECLIWASLTFLILWLARRFPLGQRSWPRSLLIHVAACLGCGFIAASLSALAAELIRREIPKPSITPKVMIYFFLAKLNNNIFFYGAILALAHVVNYHRQWRERELLASQLEAKLAQQLPSRKSPAAQRRAASHLWPSKSVGALQNSNPCNNNPYLTRQLIASHFQNVPPGKFTWLSFVISSVFFGLLHGRWLAGTLAGLCYALVLYRGQQMGILVVGLVGALLHPRYVTGVSQVHVPTGPHRQLVGQIRSPRPTFDGGPHHLAARLGELDGPAHDAGLAVTSFPGRHLALAERPRRAGVIAVRQPRPVVGGVDHQGLLVEIVFLERRQDLTRRPINLHDDVAVKSLFGFALELIGNVQGHVRHGVGHVQEEGLLHEYVDRQHSSRGYGEWGP